MEKTSRNEITNISANQDKHIAPQKILDNDPYELTKEEGKATRPIRDKKVAETLIPLKTYLASSKKLTLAEVENKIARFGKDLYDYFTKTDRQNTFDASKFNESIDNDLYVMRLSAHVAMKQQAKTFADADKAAKIDTPDTAWYKKIDALTNTLEQNSRGFTSVNFPAASKDKKILLSGFDPFGGDTSNLSGIVALYFHGKTISGGGKSALVQSVVFPVRYEDFDKGMVENHFDKYVQGGNVDAIVTVSLGRGKGIAVERLAGNYRGGAADNNEKSGSSAVPLSAGKNFYETTLPIDALLADQFTKNDKNEQVPKPNQSVYLNQAYETENGEVYPRAWALDAVDNPPKNLPNKDYDYSALSGKGTAKRGSGGNFLSNEIFTRVAHSVETEKAKNPSTKSPIYGHLHIERMKTNADKIKLICDMETVLQKIVGTL